MTDTIWAAIITGGLGLVGTVVSIVWGKSQKDRAARAEEQAKKVELQAQKLGEAFKTGVLERYGFKAETACSHVTFLDAEGTHRIEREWQGMKIVHPAIRLSHMPFVLWVDTPGGRFRTKPSLRKRPTDRQFSKVLDLSVDCSEQNPVRCNIRLSILPDLSDQDNAFGFSFAAEIEKGFLMTRAQVEKAYRKTAYPLEYHTFDVEFPLDRLEIRIVFQEGFRVSSLAPIVFFGKSEVIHELELQKVKNGFKPEQARFEITDPLIGFRYGSAWLPAD